MLTEATAAAHKLLSQSNDVLVLGHIRPDGDAIGSVLGLALALRQAGKNAAALIPGGVPGRFQFLPGADQALAALPDKRELVVALDTAALDRLALPPETLGAPIDVNVDHHPTNTAFGQVNIVEPTAAATTQVLHRLIPAWGLKLTEPVCTCLLAGLITDTIGFRTSSTTAESLEVAAQLVRGGASIADIYDQALSRISLSDARYWGAGLSQLEYDDGIVTVSLTREMRNQVGYPGDDDADLVNLLMTIEEAQVVVLFVEQGEQQVKISWRSRPGVDVAAIAVEFGGGGHKAAAGASLTRSLADARPQVLAATRRALEQA